MKCEICKDGKEFTNLQSHLRTKHQMSLEEYNKEHVTEESFDEVNEEEVSAGVTDPIKVRENVFDGPKEWSLDMTMKEYLDKKNLTFTELNSLVDRFIEGSAIDVTFQMKKNVERGEKGAENLKDQKNVETPDLIVAETLVKKYGFTVTSVVGQKPNKKWILVRK